MLEVKTISKSFKIDEERLAPILNNISINFPNKGFYFIVGKSGSGKSTLLNILMGLMKPDEGEIIFNGSNVSSFSQKDLCNYLRNDVGIIFQHYNLFDSMTVKENLEISMSIKGVDDYNLMQNLLIKYHLDGKLDQKIKSLSGGEKQRVALIRALLSKPKILFCDEPTGALDKENSLTLMQDLQSLSRKILVICVSHNKKLYEEFNDGYIELSNGKLTFNSISSNNENDIIKEENKNKGTLKYTNIISRNNMKKNKKINTINAISACFSIFVMIISLFFKGGIQNAKDSMIHSFPDYNVFSVSKVEEEEIDNSLINLVKSSRPEYEELESLTHDIKSCLIFDDFSYFLNGTSKIVGENSSLSGFSLKPFYDGKLENNEIVVNKSFLNEFEKENEEELKEGVELTIRCQKEYVYFNEIRNENIVESFNKDISLKIGYIADEFSYLSTPTIYYSPIYLEEILKTTEATRSTAINQEKTTFLDLIKSAENDDAITNYSMIVIATKEESRANLIKLIEEEATGNLSFLNNANTIVTSFLTLSDSVFIGVNIFIFIALLTSIFISAFLSYSTSLKNRKESAILTVLGAKTKDIIKIYVKEERVFTLFGLIFGIALSIGFSYFANQFLAGFFVTKTLINLNYVTVLFIFLLLAILNLSIDYLTVRFQKHKNIYEELKEE